jgi:hypothetical protein
MDCLQETAEVHTEYELVQIGTMANPAFHGEPAKIFGVAVLEAYLIHVRNVDEFLVTRRGKRQYPEQVIAADSFDDTQWSPPTLCIGQEDATHFSRKIAHIYCDREDAFAWKIPGLLARFAHRVFDCFESDFLKPLAAAHSDRADSFEPGLRAGHGCLDLAEQEGVIDRRVVARRDGLPKLWSDGAVPNSGRVTQIRRSV